MVATVSDTLASGNQCTITGLTDIDPATAGIQIEVAAGSSSDYDYSCALTTEPTMATDTNTVTVEWDRATYPQTEDQFNNPGSAGTGSAEDPVTFTYDVTEINKGITVHDALNGESVGNWDLVWEDGAAGVGKVRPITYTETVTPPSGTCTTYSNRAVIGGTPWFDTESLDICAGADLTIDKTTAQSFGRSYDWEIDKSAIGAGPYMADPDTGDVTVGYRVTVTPNGYLDSSWMMNGTIVVTNPNDWKDIPVTVLDNADFGPGAQCTVTGVQGNTAIVDADPVMAGFQTTIPSDTTWTFQYNCSFSQQPNYTGTNTAVVNWDSDAASTPSDSTSDVVNVVDADWDMTPVNETIQITDSHYTFLAPWNVSVGQGEQYRDYEVIWNVGTAGLCQPFTNTATMIGDDDVVLGSDSETISGCREADVTVSKTATAAYDREHHWAIDKYLPTGDHWGQVVGDDGTATFDYIVAVDYDGYTDSNWSLAFRRHHRDEPKTSLPFVVTVSDATSISGRSPGAVVDPTARHLILGGRSSGFRTGFRFNGCRLRL